MINYYKERNILVLGRDSTIEIRNIVNIYKNTHKTLFAGHSGPEPLVLLIPPPTNGVTREPTLGANVGPTCLSLTYYTL